jgi:histidyl-tRNA synthetase
MLSTQNYKGTRDFYPEDLAKRNYIFDQWRSVLTLHGFDEYETSLLESKEIYTAKSGEDLANNQLYWFTDKGERQVALRPEQTPSLARVVAAKIQELSLPVRWFTIPNCFRYERPQKGRLREFWQLNVDIVGSDSWACDAELLVLVYRLFEKLGATTDQYSIKLNNRLVLDQWISHKGWQAKKETVYAMLDSWHKLDLTKKTEWLTTEGINFNFDALNDKDSIEYKEYLGLLQSNEQFWNIWKLVYSVSPEAFVIDPTIVRGIAYYTGTVFEANDKNPENPRALFGGGRYNDLLELFGKSAPAVGFGWGDVTMHEFLEYWKLYPELNTQSTTVGILVSTTDKLEEALMKQTQLAQVNTRTVLDTSFERSLNKREQSLIKRVGKIISI